MEPVYTKINVQPEENSNSRTPLEVALLIKCKKQNDKIIEMFVYLVALLILLILFVTLFALAIQGVLKGDWTKEMIEDLPTCRPPDGLVHSFDDVIKTLENFNCEKALDVVNAIHITTISKCWNYTKSVSTRNDNYKIY